MISTNLPPIFHRFRDIAVDRSKIAIFYYPFCVQLPRRRSSPGTISVKFLVDVNGWPRYLMPQKYCRKKSIAWVWRTNVTDRRQTDGRAIAYSEREREFTFAKNETKMGNNSVLYKKLLSSTVGATVVLQFFNRLAMIAFVGRVVRFAVSILLLISQGCRWPWKWAPYMGALSAAGWAWSLHGNQTWIGNCKQVTTGRCAWTRGVLVLPKLQQGTLPL